jgi:methyl-accepting chemotaxis protein
MTPAPEQRLDQLEQIVKTVIKITKNNSQAIADLGKKTQENTESIARLTQNMQQLNEMFIESVRIIREMQNEVRGMQTENQRIIRHLFGDSEA